MGFCNPFQDPNAARSHVTRGGGLERHPIDISWDQQWHEILDLWKAKVRQVCEHYSLSDWATTALKQYWELAAYVVSLPQDRWMCRALNWIPDFGRRNAQARLRQSWDDKLSAYCRWRALGTWKDTARNFFFWLGCNAWMISCNLYICDVLSPCRHGYACA